MGETSAKPPIREILDSTGSLLYDAQTNMWWQIYRFRPVVPRSSNPAASGTVSLAQPATSGAR
jgi:hypothetical protein